MPGRGDPVLHDLFKLHGGHACVGDHDDSQDRLVPTGQGRLHFALEQRGKALGGLPFGMLRSYRLVQPAEKLSERIAFLFWLGEDHHFIMMRLASPSRSL